jgi:hypothetical protein
MRGMKIIIIALVFMAVIRLSGFISRGNADVQTAAIMISALVIIWYAAKVICFACRERDTFGSGHDSGKT